MSQVRIPAWISVGVLPAVNILLAFLVLGGLAAIPGIWVMGKREKIDVVARAALQRGRRQTAHFNSGRLRWLHAPATSFYHPDQQVTCRPPGRLFTFTTAGQQ